MNLQFFNRKFQNSKKIKLKRFIVSIHIVVTVVTFVNLSNLQAIYKQTFTEYFQIYKVRFTETSEEYEGLPSDFRDLHDLHTQIYRKFTDLQTISKMRFTSIFSRDLQKSLLWLRLES